MSLTFCVPCLFGLEGLAAQELKRLGMEEVRTEDRRVFFQGDYLQMARANLNLRMGERVMIHLASFEAMTFEELYQGVKHIPLEEFIPATGTFPVKGYSLNSQLHSVPDCQSIVKKAAVDRLSTAYGIKWFEETGPVYQLHFSIMKNKCDVFLDTSGVGLHKRGYREFANAAPIHETMAAAMVELSKFRGKEPLWDPFCGSGTICIEAALIALNRAPGLSRSFVAQKWKCVDETVWRQARTEALDKEFRGHYEITGTDIDREALAIAMSNAKKAGVEKIIHFAEGNATKMRAPAEKGTIVTNPPYGERLMEQESAKQLYKAFGSNCKNFSDWKITLISSEPEFEYYFGKRAEKKRKLYNGRLQCNVYLYSNYGNSPTHR